MYKRRDNKCIISYKKGGKSKMKKQDKKIVAKALTIIANNALSVAASSRCMSVYHQPKQPDAVKRFRRF